VPTLLLRLALDRPGRTGKRRRATRGARVDDAGGGGGDLIAVERPELLDQGVAVGGAQRTQPAGVASKHVVGPRLEQCPLDDLRHLARIDPLVGAKRDHRLQARLLELALRIDVQRPFFNVAHGRGQTVEKRSYVLDVLRELGRDLVLSSVFEHGGNLTRRPLPEAEAVT